MTHPPPHPRPPRPQPRPPLRRRRRPLRLAAAAVAAALGLTGAGLLYSTQLQPGSLIPVDGIEIVEPEEAGPHRLFVYGTLRSPLLRFALTGRLHAPAPAVLPGFRREGRGVSFDPGAAVEGDVVHVSTAELRRLDRYERTGLDYERVELVLDDGAPAWVYRTLPDR